MNLSRRISVAFLSLFMAGCSSGSEPPRAADTAPASAAPSTSAKGISGRIAPSLAPPSALIVLDAEGQMELPVKTEPAIMDQAGYEFLPEFLVVQTGQPVQFRNSEDVLHNVRVNGATDQKPVFNVATVAFGKYEFKFEEPGYYNVGCDIHSTMRASILVVPSPYTATTGQDGSFTIAGVKPGRYKLTIYAGAAPVVRSIEVSEGRTDLGLLQ